MATLVAGAPRPLDWGYEVAQGFRLAALDEHVCHCVKEAAQAGDASGADQMISEATKAIERLVRA